MGSDLGSLVCVHFIKVMGLNWAALENFRIDNIAFSNIGNQCAKGGEIMMPTRIGSSHRPAASVHPPAGLPMSASQRQRVRSHPRGVEFGSWIWPLSGWSPPRR